MHLPTATAPAYAITMANAADVELRLSGSISWWKNSGAEFTNRITAMLGQGAKNVRVYLNSGGGQVLEANEIVNQIARFTGKKSVHVGALCASAATLVLLAVPKENRYGAKNGMYMTHPPSLGIEGTADELRAAAKVLDKFAEQIKQTYMDECGLSEAEATALLTGTNWMTATEAKEKGFIGHVDTKAKITEEDKKVARNVLNTMPMVPHGLLVTAGLLDSSDTDQTLFNDQPNTTNMVLNSVLAAALGVALTANDGQIEAAITALSDKAQKAEAEVTRLTAELDTAKASVAKDRAEILVKDALAAKKILANDKEQWQGFATANYDLAKRQLALIPAVKNLGEGLEADPEENPEAAGAGAKAEAGREKWSFADWMKNDAEGLAKLKASNRTKYAQMYKAQYGVDLPITA